MKPAISLLFLLGLHSGAAAVAAQDKNTATFDADGTAHVTRVIRPPATISPEAQKWMDSLRKNVSHDGTLEERRKRTDEWRARQSAVAKKLFPVNIEEQTIGGVRCDVITPLETPEANRNRVLINLHGGGFNSDSGSLFDGGSRGAVQAAGVAFARRFGDFFGASRLQPRG
jgi:acetyl esterase/lipase